MWKRKTTRAPKESGWFWAATLDMSQQSVVSSRRGITAAMLLHSCVNVASKCCLRIWCSSSLRRCCESKVWAKIDSTRAHSWPRSSDFEERLLPLRFCGSFPSTPASSGRKSVAIFSTSRNMSCVLRERTNPDHVIRDRPTPSANLSRPTTTVN